jgi:hypothetical protein
MRNPLLYWSGSAGERSGGARKVPYCAARSNSERAAPSACVGKRFSGPQIVSNRSTRRAGARGGGERNGDRLVFFQSRQDSFVRLRDESLEESDKLPDPDVLAQESSKTLKPPSKQFREIAAEKDQ